MAPPLDLVEPLPAGKRGYRMQVVVAETYAAVGFVLIKMNQTHVPFNRLKCICWNFSRQKKGREFITVAT